MSVDQESGGTKRLVLVVGKGRSGTSLFSGILSRAGFHVPKPEVRADKTNPRGFGEPRWVVDFHTRLMRAQRVRVFDSRFKAWEGLAEVANDETTVAELRSWLDVQFVGTDNVVVKDPRIVWFLPLWSRCAQELRVQTAFATMLRHPTEVVTSARTSYGTWQTDASRAASWLNVILHAEHATRGSRRAFVRYEDLLEDWPREVSRCGDLLDIPWLVAADRSQYPEVEAFIDPALRRSQPGWEALQVPPDLQTMCEDVWETMSALADPGGDTDEARSKLDGHRAAYIDFYSAAESVAQSSVTAVKPRPRAFEHTGRRGSGGRGQNGVKRMVPERVRSSLVPRSVRESLRMSEGLPFPIRVMLLLPPSYRERLPLPAFRAARRVVRAMRR
jgi:hypothetical protein